MTGTSRQADPQAQTPVLDSWRITPTATRELNLDLRQGHDNSLCLQ